MTTWKNDYISKNDHSRPGTLLKGVKKLVLHWTSNPGASAANHQKYFNNLKDRYASAHIFVDKEEVICIIPLNEMAYHANDTYQRSELGVAFRGVPEISPNANQWSIGVEMCVEKDGTISKEVINRTVQVFAELCKMYKLTENDIVRHYDITHKPCPEPFVDNVQLFIDFKKQVGNLLHPVVVAKPKPPVYPGHVIKKGDKGDAVRLIQKALKVSVDGIFGDITLKAVKTFQKQNKLTVDGLIGKNTWNKMFPTQ